MNSNDIDVNGGDENERGSSCVPIGSRTSFSRELVVLRRDSSLVFVAGSSRKIPVHLMVVMMINKLTKSSPVRCRWHWSTPVPPVNFRKADFPIDFSLGHTKTCQPFSGMNRGSTLPKSRPIEPTDLVGLISP